MNCSSPDCPELATLLIRSDGATSDGMIVLILRDGWERFGPNLEGIGLYCTEHAGHFLSRLPQVALHLGVATGDSGEVYTHG